MWAMWLQVGTSVCVCLCVCVLYSQVGRNSVWYKVAVFTGARFDEGAKSVRVAAAGPRNIVTAYKVRTHTTLLASLSRPADTKCIGSTCNTRATEQQPWH